jgi:hypothetical protein
LLLQLLKNHMMVDMVAADMVAVDMVVVVGMVVVGVVADSYNVIMNIHIFFYLMTFYINNKIK